LVGGGPLSSLFSSPLLFFTGDGLAFYFLTSSDKAAGSSSNVDGILLDVENKYYLATIPPDVGE